MGEDSDKWVISDSLVGMDGLRVDGHEWRDG